MQKTKNQLLNEMINNYIMAHNTDCEEPNPICCIKIGKDEIKAIKSQNEVNIYPLMNDILNKIQYTVRNKSDIIRIFTSIQEQIFKQIKNRADYELLNQEPIQDKTIYYIYLIALYDNGVDSNNIISNNLLKGYKYNNIFAIKIIHDNYNDYDNMTTTAYLYKIKLEEIEFMKKNN